MVSLEYGMAERSDPHELLEVHDLKEWVNASGGTVVIRLTDKP